MAVLVGKKAPSFKAKAVVNGGEIIENFSLDKYLNKQHVVLFFYPADFTFVCPTELIAFQQALKDFEKLDTAVVGCSVDSEFSHWKWLQTELKDGGIKGVTYPLVSDFAKTIAENFDVMAGKYDIDDDGNTLFTGAPVAYRGTFLIDKQGVVRHQVVNDLPLGRNIEDTLRTVEALQFVELHGEVCPANWKKGEKAMKATQEGVASYLGSLKK
jgi:peroxiredoxin (alkyl hydroperoxide reductase subunit C)